jgi:thiol-disulfide isomerase/thioredoxin
MSSIRVINKIRIFFVIIVFFFLVGMSEVEAKEKNLVNVYLFHSSSCSHCRSEIKFWNSIVKKYDNVRFYKYEISSDKNKQYMEDVAYLYKISGKSVPLVIIGDKSFVGYSEENSNVVFMNAIKYYSDYGYEDRVAMVVGNKKLPSYEVKENQISINKFLKNYGNYRLVSNLETKNINMETISLLCSLLLELNVGGFLVGLIMMIISFKFKNDKERLILFSMYVFSCLFFNLLFLIVSSWWLLIGIVIGSIFVLLVSLIAFGNKIRNNKIRFVILGASIAGLISNIFKFLINVRYKNIFLESIKLHWLSLIDVIIQYSINMMICLVICVFGLLAEYYGILIVEKFLDKTLLKGRV